MPYEKVQSESAKQRRYSDLNSPDRENSLVQHELDVGDPCQALAGQIDDLRVEHVPCEQELVIGQGRGSSPLPPGRELRRG